MPLALFSDVPQTWTATARALGLGQREARDEVADPGAWPRPSFLSEAPPLVGSAGETRFTVRARWESRGGHDSRQGFYRSDVSVYFAKPLWADLAIQRLFPSGRDQGYATALVTRRDPDGWTALDRLRAMAATPGPLRWNLLADDEKVTCEIRPSWGSFASGIHPLGARPIDWAIRTLLPIAHGVDIARAELGAPAWVGEAARDWETLAQPHGLQLDAEALRLEGPRITCQHRTVGSSHREYAHCTWLYAPLAEAAERPFAIDQAAGSGSLFRLVATVAGRAMSTGEPTFDARFMREGDPPAHLLEPAMRSLLIDLDTKVNERDGGLSVSHHGIRVRLPGLPRAKSLASFMEPMLALAGAAKPDERPADPYR